MSSLPSISHHLFVAAAGLDDRLTRKALRPGPEAAVLQNSAPELPLEVLEPGDPVPAGVVRSLMTPETLGRR
jgi:hypothetical protein